MQELHSEVSSLVWTPADSWADSLLEQWGRWSRADHENIGYPKDQPFAIKARGGAPICDLIAEKVDAVLIGMSQASRSVIKAKYNAKEYVSPKIHLAVIREFANAYSCS